MSEYDDQIESKGLDEASIDVTDYLEKNGMDNMDGRIFLGSKIRKDIFEAT